MTPDHPEPAGVAGPADHADAYDRFVDWGARLAREAPLFRRLFEEAGVRRLVDVGSGTGMHAAMWASWGLDVTGVDPSPSMLAKARDHAISVADEVRASGGALRFLEGGFGGLASLGLRGIDAITCTGNALPHVDGEQGLHATLDDFAAAMRPGGVLVLHLLNHDRLLEKRIRAIPPVVRDAEDGTWVFLRIVDYAPGRLLLDFVTMRRPGGWAGDAPWEIRSRKTEHAALPSALLVSELRATGFERIELLGSHDGRVLDPVADESVIVVARRR